VLIPSLSPGSFVVRFGEAGLRRIAVRFDAAKPAALFVIRRSIRDGLAEYVALIKALLASFFCFCHEAPVRRSRDVHVAFGRMHPFSDDAEGTV
jgi:hypothetical protein